MVRVGMEAGVALGTESAARLPRDPPSGALRGRGRASSMPQAAVRTRGRAGGQDRKSVV